MFLSISKSKWQIGFRLGLCFALFHVVLSNLDDISLPNFKKSPETTQPELSYLNAFENKDMVSSAYAPAIAIIKTGVPDLLAPCRQINYTYTVTNESTNGEILDNVEVIDPLFGMNPLPGPSSGDIGNDGLLGPNEIWEYDPIYFITNQDKINGQVGGNATVTAVVQGQGISVNDQSDDDSVLENDPTIIDISNCRIAIALVKTSMLNACDNIRYRFDVTNVSLDGDNLENIQIEDPLLGPNPIMYGPPPSDNGDGFLNPNETWTYFESYIVLQSDKNNGEVVNQAEVTANVVGSPNDFVTDLSDDNSVLENDSTVTDLSACQPRVAMVKTGTIINNCSQIEYEFYVSNTGAQVLTNVEIIDPLFGNLPLPGPDPLTDLNSDGNLDLNEVWEYSITYDIDQADLNAAQVVNQATVTAEILVAPNNFVNDLSDDNIIFEDHPTVTDLTPCINPEIAVIKQGQVFDMDADGCDDHILYEFTVANLGDVDLAAVTLDDVFLGGVIPGPISGDVGNDNILGIGEEWIYNFIYDITQADIDQGNVENQAEVKANLSNNVNIQVADFSDNDSYNEDDITQTDVVGACDEHGGPLGLIKTGSSIDSNGDGCADQIQYAFSVTNQSPLDLNQVTLEDNGLVLGVIAGPDSGDTGNDGIMGPNEVWNYSATYTITQADIDATEVVNQAEARANLILSNNPYSDFSDDDSYAENDPTITSVIGACIPSPDIGLIKQGELVDSNDNGCKESIIYTFTVANLGNVNLESVTLQDNILGITLSEPNSGDTGNDGILGPDEEWTYTLVHGLTEADIDATQVQNQAEVTAVHVGTQNVISDFSDDSSYSEDGFTVISVVGACVGSGNPNFEIFNGITPNGDGLNDHFHIEGIDNYPVNTLKIFNRWGVLVYEISEYDQANNLFRGVSEGRANIATDRELPSGTYFYILTFPAENPGQKSYSGYLYINRD
ncbi:MAG: gliding motility-associated C-terminal domain-containing protein [Allomuricauda sp.]